MRSISLLFAVAACLAMAVSAAARDCGGCGGGAGCKTCELVCGTETTEVTCFSCKCEPFCLPRPTCNLFSIFRGKLGGKACGGGCGEGCEPAGCDIASDDDGGGCSGEPPVCGKVRTRKKLLMRVVKVEVPAYQCAVGSRDGCDDESALVEPPAPEPDPVAPAPAPPAQAYDAPPIPLR